MSDEQNKNAREEVGIGFPGGLRAWVRGRHISGPMYFTIITLLAFWGVAYLVYTHNADNQAQRVAAVTALEKQHTRLADNQVRLEQSLSEMIYVLSLSEAERAQLRLQMPDSLRRKQERR